MEDRREELVDLLRFEIEFKKSLIISLSSQMLSVVALTGSFIAVFISVYEKVLYGTYVYSNNIIFSFIVVLLLFLLPLSPLIFFIIKNPHFVKKMKEVLKEVGEMNDLLIEITDKGSTTQQIREKMERLDLLPKKAKKEEKVYPHKIKVPKSEN